MNARQELMYNINYNPSINKRKIKCARIRFTDNDYDEQDDQTIILNVIHTPKELEEFWESLNTSYNNGFGEQELFGFVWFHDNTWLSREEYKGCERWIFNEFPEIPKELQNDVFNVKLLTKETISNHECKKRTKTCDT